MSTGYVRLGLAVCLLLQDGVAFALSPFTVSHWDADDGLPPGPTLSVLQARDGYIWLGTQEGLARFDGVACTIFDTRNTPALKANRIAVVYQDRKGALWIGTAGGGLTRLLNGQFRTFSTAEGLRNNQIRALLEDREGTLWVGTDGGGLFRSDGEGFTRLEVDGERFVMGLGLAFDGALLAAFRQTLRRIQAGKIETYRAEDLGVGDLTTILCDTNGVTWLGGQNGARSFRQGNFRDAVNDLTLRNVEALHPGEGSDLWIGTAYGLFRWDGERVTKYTTAEGLSGNVISCAFADHEGNVWVGNNASGVDQLKRTKFQAYTPRQGLSHEVATCVYQDSRGDMWIGTEGGLNHLKDGQVTRYTTNNGLSWNLVFTVCEDRDGNMWVGTLRHLNRFANGKFTVFGSREGLPASAIWCSFRDRAGTLWIGTRDGLAKYRPESGTFQTLDHDNAGLSHDDVRAICEDRDGRLWVGTSYGLNRLEGDRFVAFRTVAGDRSLKIVLALHVDSEGILWIGTMDKGLFRHKDGEFTAYTTRDGLHDDLIHQILEDDQANLWFTCNRGIFRVGKQQLNEFADGKVNRIHCTVFGRADGLPSAQCNGTIQPAGWKSRDGRLWFPTLKGVAVIDPANIRRNLQPPPVRIEQVLFDGRPLERTSYTSPESIRVQPGVERVDIHYTGLSFVAPQHMRFQHRLEGLDREWVDAENARAARYTHLPPRQYRFHVKAANNDGLWNETGASLAFVVVPPWWQTWWSMTAGVVLSVVCVAGIVRAHAARKYRFRMAALERQQALERERSRIARDMHDGLGSSMVKIAMLGELLEDNLDSEGHLASAAREPLRSQARKLTAAARQVVREMDEVVWTINPKNDSLENLAGYIGHFAREHFADTGIQCHLEIPTEFPNSMLTAEVRHNLFMAAKEAINNILKHAHATQVHLHLQIDPSELTITIRDNGCGLPRWGETPSSPPRAGHGWENMQQRLKRIGGRLSVVSQTGQGTQLIMSVPLGSSETRS